MSKSERIDVWADFRVSFTFHGQRSGDSAFVGPSSGESVVCYLEDLIEEFLVRHPKVECARVERKYEEELCKAGAPEPLEGERLVRCKYCGYLYIEDQNVLKDLLRRPSARFSCCPECSVLRTLTSRRGEK